MTKELESSTSHSSRLSRLAPGLGLLRTYERNWLRPDLVAGITLAGYLTGVKELGARKAARETNKH